MVQYHAIPIIKYCEFYSKCESENKVPKEEINARFAKLFGGPWSSLVYDPRFGVGKTAVQIRPVPLNGDVKIV